MDEIKAWVKSGYSPFSYCHGFEGQYQLWGG